MSRKFKIAAFLTVLITLASIRFAAPSGDKSPQKQAEMKSRYDTYQQKMKENQVKPSGAAPAAVADSSRPTAVPNEKPIDIPAKGEVPVSKTEVPKSWEPMTPSLPEVQKSALPVAAAEEPTREPEKTARTEANPGQIAPPSRAPADIGSGVYSIYLRLSNGAVVWMRVSPEISTSSLLNLSDSLTKACLSVSDSTASNPARDACPSRRIFIERPFSDDLSIGTRNILSVDEAPEFPIRFPNRNLYLFCEGAGGCSDGPLYVGENKPQISVLAKIEGVIFPKVKGHGANGPKAPVDADGLRVMRVFRTTRGEHADD